MASILKVDKLQSTGGVTKNTPLQVVTTTINTRWDLGYNSSNWQEVAGFNVTLTPTSSNSKVLLDFNIAYGGGNRSGDWHNIFWRLYRGTTHLSGASGPTSGNQDAGMMGGLYRYGYHHTQTVRLLYLDSPATTSSTTYKLYARCGTYGAGTHRINDSWNQSTSYSGGGASTVMAMEIAQ